MVRHLTLLAFLLAVFFGSLHALQRSERQTRSGDGTFYNPGLGACGFWSGPGEMIVAMAHADFDPGTPGGNPNNNRFCNRMISVSGPRGSVTVKVVDRCGGCKSGDLDLSPAAFDRIGDRNAGRIRITWRML